MLEKDERYRKIQINQAIIRLPTIQAASLLCQNGVEKITGSSVFRRCKREENVLIFVFLSRFSFDHSSVTRFFFSFSDNDTHYKERRTI
jgi:hypothetical protein